MQMDVQHYKDCLLRYGSIFKIRHNSKQKDIFLKSLITDITSFRNDIQVKEYIYDSNLKTKHFNLYVGDVKNAKYIIVSYYDTPSVSYGDYMPFNMHHNQRQTLLRIFTESILAMLIGIFAIFLLKDKLDFSHPDWITILTSLAIILYFYIFSKITKGRASKNTIIRNTSSILAMLTAMYTISSNKIAYAFVDDGCTNQSGLALLKRETNAKLIYLDSIGASKNLYLLTNGVSTCEDLIIVKTKISENMVHITSGMIKNDEIYVPDIGVIQEENIERVMKYIKKEVE